MQDMECIFLVEVRANFGRAEWVGIEENQDIAKE
jgi:hypothetical protein